MAPEASNTTSRLQDAEVRCRSVGAVLVSWKFIAEFDPRQTFRTMCVELRREVLRLLEASGVEVNLVGILVVFECHWRSTIGAKQPACAWRRPVHLWFLAGKAKRPFWHAEPCCEWRRRVSPTALTVAMAAPVFWTAVLKRDLPA